MRLLELDLGLDMALLLDNLGQFVLGGVPVLGLNRVIFSVLLTDTVKSMIARIAFIISLSVQFYKPRVYSCV